MRFVCGINVESLIIRLGAGTFKAGKIILVIYWGGAGMVKINNPWSSGGDCGGRLCRVIYIFKAYGESEFSFYK